MNISIPCLLSLELAYSSVSPSVVFHPTANPPLLATFTGCIVKLWLLSPDNSRATCVNTIDMSDGYKHKVIQSVLFHPTTNPPLLVISGNYFVRLWQLSHDNSSVISLGAFRDPFQSIAFHPTANPPILASGRDREVKLWHLSLSVDDSSVTRSDTLFVRTFTHGLIPVYRMAFHPTANPPLLATCSEGIVTLWLLSPGKKSHVSIDLGAGADKPVKCLEFHPTADPPIMVTSFRGGTVKLWQLSPDNTSATCVAILDGYHDSVSFHPTANPPILATGSERSVKLWQLSPDNTSATCVATLDRSNGGHSGAVTCVAFHPTAPLLGTGGKDGAVKLWDCRQLNTRGQLAIASRGVGAMSRLLSQRLGHDPSVHPTLAFKKNLLKGILANTTRKSLARMLESTDIADRLKRYFSHGARAPGMPGIMRMSSKLAVPQFPLQSKQVLTLKNGESPKGSKSPKGRNGGSRRRKIKAKTVKIKNKKYILM